MLVTYTSIRLVCSRFNSFPLSAVNFYLCNRIMIFLATAQKKIIANFQQQEQILPQFLPSEGLIILASRNFIGELECILKIYLYIYSEYDLRYQCVCLGGK